MRALVRAHCTSTLIDQGSLGRGGKDNQKHNLGLVMRGSTMERLQDLDRDKGGDQIEISIINMKRITKMVMKRTILDKTKGEDLELKV